MAFASWQMQKVQKVQKVQKGPGGLVGVQESPGLSALSASHPLRELGLRTINEQAVPWSVAFFLRASRL